MSEVLQIADVGAAQDAPAIKCVVWDLDETLWSGVLAEGDAVELRPGCTEAVHELDRRGILQSVCSKNAPADALASLERVGLLEYFLYPQIGWGAKSAGVAKIAELLNISLDAFAFVDDQTFERDEVRASHPSVLCFESDDLRAVLTHPRLNPAVITPEALNRRLMYRTEAERRKVEAEFQGPQEEFLASLRMVMSVRPAAESDLERAAELTVRTHQLNTTGQVYSLPELNRLCSDPSYLVYTAQLEDKYGSYGIIGLAVAEVKPDQLVVKLLLTSCRVLSRGVGMILLIYLMRVAEGRGLALRAEFSPNEKNRMMGVTLRFAGFKECGRSGGLITLQRSHAEIPQYPEYVEVRD